LSVTTPFVSVRVTVFLPILKVTVPVGGAKVEACAR